VKDNPVEPSLEKMAADILTKTDRRKVAILTKQLTDAVNNQDALISLAAIGMLVAIFSHEAPAGAQTCLSGIFAVATKMVRDFETKGTSFNPHGKWPLVS
jgi:hypothetical protein